MKIVLQKSFGIASLSKIASDFLIEKKGKEAIKEDQFLGKTVYYPTVSRWDKSFVEVIETFGKKAFGEISKFEVVEINEPFKIENYDGVEYIVTLSDFEKNLIYPDKIEIED